MFQNYKSIICLDFEFRHDDGEALPNEVVCCVAKDLVTGKTWRLSGDQCRAFPVAPYPCGRESLFVCWNAVAELSCHMALGWGMPANVLDLMVCHMATVNGLSKKASLVEGLKYHGMGHLAENEKEEMRNLAMRGGPYSTNEMDDLLKYCETDVIALEQILPPVSREIAKLPNGLAGCLAWGRYMKAVTKMMVTGIPLDRRNYHRLLEGWQGVLRNLKNKAHDLYGVYQEGTFSFKALERLLCSAGIPWKRTTSGRLDDSSDYWKAQGKAYPKLKFLADVKRTLRSHSELKLTVGSDGRNRSSLFPFRTKTSRNAPSSNRFVMNCPSWMRAMVTPPEGRALVVSDYSAEEPWLMGVLAGDKAILDAYANEGDFYLNIARRMGLCDLLATRKTHPDLRGKIKVLVLAASYGMGTQSAATLMQTGESEAISLMRKFRQAHKTYFDWVKVKLDATWLDRSAHTRFGWPINVPPEPNERSFMNFPLQAHGADILRILCCDLTESGFSVCYPLHDAVGVEVDLGTEKEAVTEIESKMVNAAGWLGSDVPIQVESRIILPGRRYIDDDQAEQQWEEAMRALEEAGV
jgi:DNA polymerase-1